MYEVDNRYPEIMPLYSDVRGGKSYGALNGAAAVNRARRASRVNDLKRGFWTAAAAVVAVLSLSAWGVEGRVPFLDKEFLDVAMRTNPEAKMCPGTTMEKKIVREAFADMLPKEVAWRQKEQFSDGVGYSWIDTLKQITSEAVSDEQMVHAAERFPINPPKNKEEYYYRSIFAEHFPSDSAAKSVPSEASVACSTAIALEWDAAFKGMNDPSGRAVKGVHEQAY